MYFDYLSLYCYSALVVGVALFILLLHELDNLR